MQLQIFRFNFLKIRSRQLAKESKRTSIFLNTKGGKAWTAEPSESGAGHTVAIWTFTFHKKSGCAKVIWKANFKPAYGPKLSILWPENSDLLNSFFFYFLKELSYPLLFAHCYCFSNELNYLSCDLMQKHDFMISTFLE